MTDEERVQAEKDLALWYHPTTEPKQKAEAMKSLSLIYTALRRTAEDDKARPYSIGAKAFWLPSDGVLKDHIIEIAVHGYSESAWQGSKNIGKDHRFIICHNSYNEPHAYPIKECYATRQAAEAALGGEGGE